MSEIPNFELEFDWVHVQYAETSQFVETYGFSGSQGMVNLEGVKITPKGHPSKTLLMFMHPATTLQLLPMPQAIAKQGVHVFCGGSRYAKNDTSLIFEKVALDMGAYVRHAKEVWGYENVILGAWSGGGSLGLFYQSQAENPSITETPAGDPVDLKAANLMPADGIIFQAAHLSRARTMTDWLDPSVKDEENPDDRLLELDLYDPRNPYAKPPYDRDWLETFRAAQKARNRKITAIARDRLLKLKAKAGGEVERPFITHRTMAEPRFLDGTLDPNDRAIGTCFLGNPETVNTGPVGMGRFSTLRSWLSQWSYDDSNADGPRSAARVSVPLLAVENSADDAVPQPHTTIIYESAGSKDKTMHVIKGATHYYKGQPELLQEAVDTAKSWLAERNFITL